MAGQIQSAIDNAGKVINKSEEIIDNFSKMEQLSVEERNILFTEYVENINALDTCTKIINSADNNRNSMIFDGRDYSSSVISNGESMAAAAVVNTQKKISEIKKRMVATSKPYAGEIAKHAKKMKEEAKANVKYEEKKEKEEKDAKARETLETLENEVLPTLENSFKGFTKGNQKAFMIHYVAPLTKIKMKRDLSARADAMRKFCRDMQVSLSMMVNYEQGNTDEAERLFEGRTEDGGMLDLIRTRIRNTLEAVDFKNKEAFVSFIKKRDERHSSGSEQAGPSNG